MNGPDDLKIAQLSQKDLETIRALEKKLGDGIRLVAVEKEDVLYALDAKLGPNKWQRVDEIYPEIKNLKAYFKDYEKAKRAKADLKNFLITNKIKPALKKRPIRIRQIVDTEKQ